MFKRHVRPSSILRALAAALIALSLGQIVGRSAKAWPEFRSGIWSGFWTDGWTVLGSGVRSGPPPDAAAAQVIEVIDGDTLVIEGGEHVRLLGIDTPETHHPDMPRPQALGPEAAARLEALVGGREVQLEADRIDRDRYGRLLRHVWIGRRLAGEILAGEGLAHVLIIPPNQLHAEALRAAAASAQSRRLGLWGLARPTPLPLFQTAPPATTPSVP
jgi:micrococcal nuclease